MTKQADRQIFVCSETFISNYEGAPIKFVQDLTRVRAGHPLLTQFPDKFKPVDAHYEVPEVEQATAAPGERRG